MENHFNASIVAMSKRTRRKDDLAGFSLPPVREVPLQVMVPSTVRRQVALLCAERGESMRTVVLRGLRAVGVDIAETELVDRRGRRKA